MKAHALRSRRRLGDPYECSPQKDVRRAFTIMETALALGILATVLLLVVQIVSWGLEERVRGTARQEAIEAAANILEAARACPWEVLTEQWSKAQRLPDALTQHLNKRQLTVRVEPEPSRPQTKRVTVAIHWQSSDGKPVLPVQLVGLFSARTGKRAEGKP